MTQENVRQLPYDLMGGEAAVRALCKAFYECMDKDETAADIRAMHGESLDAIEEKLFEYLSGWLGGPHLYREKYGTVCLTAPHKPYRIDEKARDQWLYCMDRALEDIAASEEVVAMVKPAFFDIANFMRNC